MKRLEVTITKTTDGEHDFLQVMSADLESVNAWFVADEIVVNDQRGEGE